MCGSKIAAQRGNRGGLGPGEGSVAVQGWVPWGLSSGEPKAFQGSPLGMLLLRTSLRVPCVCLCPLPLTLLSYTASSIYFDFKDRRVTWEYLERKLKTSFLLMRGKKNPLVNTSVIKVVTTCAAVLVLFLVVYSCVKMYLF